MSIHRAGYKRGIVSCLLREAKREKVPLLSKINAYSNKDMELAQELLEIYQAVTKPTMDDDSIAKQIQDRLPSITVISGFRHI